MRLNSIRVRGLDPYITESFIDFEAIPGELVAVIGGNGQGKSTLLNFFPAATVALNKKFLKMPKPDGRPLAELSIAKDSFLEIKYEFGQAYTVRHSINGLNGKTDCSVTNAAGQAQLKNKSGVTEFLGWAAEHALPPEVFFGSVFSSQGTRGILGMDPAERKTVVLRVRGLERIEQRAEVARNKRSECDKLLAVASGKLQELTGDTVQFCEQNLLRLTDEKRVADEALRLGELTLEDLRAKNKATEQQRAQYDALVARRNELAAQINALRTKRAQTQTRIEVGRELTDQKEAIEKAAADVSALEAKKITAVEPVGEIDKEWATAGATQERLKAELEGLRKRMEEGVAQDRELGVRLAEVENKIKEVRAIVADSEQIRAAIVETGNLQASLKVKQEEDSKQRVREAELAGTSRHLRARIVSTTERVSQLRRQKHAALLVVEEKQSVLESVAIAASRKRDIETTISEKAAYQAEIDHLQSLLTSASSNENEVLRSGHRDIIAGSDPIPRSTKALEAADDVAEEASETPARLAEAKERLAGCDEALKQYQRSLDGAVADAARLPEITAAEQTVAETTEALDVLGKEQEQLVAEENGVTKQQETLAVEIQQTKSDIAWLTEQIAGLAPLVARGELLATAKTKIEGLLQQALVIDQDRERLTTAGAALLIETGKLEEQARENANVLFELMTKKTAILAEVEGFDEQIEALQPVSSKAQMLAMALAAAKELLHQISGVDIELETLEHNHDQIERQVNGTTPPENSIELGSYETAVAQARTAANQSDAALTIAQDALARAKAREARRAELQQEVTALGQDTADWKRLADDLGKNGVQALEVDAAAPELTTLANDLLRASGDTRFSLKISTTRMDSTGKKEIEGFIIEITDSRKPNPKFGASGGEVSYINKALAFALTMMACRHAGLSGPTIIDDEGDAALDIEYAPLYVNMLRYAKRVMGASKVIFTSHRPDSWALADSRLTITAGTITTS